MTRNARFAAALFVLLASACHSEATRKKIEAMENGASPEAATNSALPAPAKPVSIEVKSDLIEFSYDWPAEAAAIPELDKRFRDDAAKQQAELVDGAREDKQAREAMGGEFHGHSLAIGYEAAGQSARLVSLSGGFDSFTGGAHGMHGTRALLWDRVAKREIKVADLFAAGGIAQLNAPWCAALDAERAKRRGEPVAKDDPFGACPKLDEVSIVPLDKDGDGRFERLSLSADPYVAGPYAEGDYEVELPVTAALIEALKPDYRPGFAAR